MIWCSWKVKREGKNVGRWKWHRLIFTHFNEHIMWTFMAKCRWTNSHEVPKSEKFFHEKRRLDLICLRWTWEAWKLEVKLLGNFPFLRLIRLNLKRKKYELNCDKIIFYSHTFRSLTIIDLLLCKYLSFFVQISWYSARTLRVWSNLIKGNQNWRDWLNEERI